MDDLQIGANWNNTSYPNKCDKCGVPIHKNNTTGFCPDCIPKKLVVPPEVLSTKEELNKIREERNAQD